MKKQYAVIGLSRFGESIALTLQRIGCDVIVIDRNEEKVNDVANLVSSAMIADVENTEVLRSIGIDKLDGVIVAIANILDSSVLATLNAKELGAKYVMSVARDEAHGKILKKIGADRVIFPEQEIGERLARNLVSGSFSDWVALSDEYSILELPVPASWVGRSLMDIDVRKKYQVNVIALKDGEGEVQVSLDAKEPFKADQRLVIIGANEKLEKIK